MTRNSNILPILFAIILGCIILLAFIGCKTTAPVVPGNTHDHNRDSVRTEYIHDSIYTDRWHTERIQGDTVFIHDSVRIDKWHRLIVRDSVYVNNTDTVINTVTIEKQGSVFLRNSGIALWVLIVLFVIAVIIGLVIKFAK